MPNISFLVAVAFCLFSKTLADHMCKDPSHHYNQHINSAHSEPCSDGSTAHCESAVYELCGAPTYQSFSRGRHVNSFCKIIASGTAIASFTGQNYVKGKGHVAIFISCTDNGGLNVADQWCGHKFSQRVIDKNCAGEDQSRGCADDYYTIQW